MQADSLPHHHPKHQRPEGANLLVQSIVGTEKYWMKNIADSIAKFQISGNLNLN